MCWTAECLYEHLTVTVSPSHRTCRYESSHFTSFGPLATREPSHAAVTEAWRAIVNAARHNLATKQPDFPSAFQLIPKVLGAGGITTLCRPVQLFHTKL